MMEGNVEIYWCFLSKSYTIDHSHLSRKKDDFSLLSRLKFFYIQHKVKIKLWAGSDEFKTIIR